MAQQQPIPYVSIPSSFLMNGSPTRLPSPAEKKRRRLKESRADLVACVECGGPAVREEVVVQRPATGTVRRVLVRCQGRDNDTKGCPVRIESESPVD